MSAVSPAQTTSAAGPPALGALFAHKAWSNHELFAALATLDAAAYPAQTHTATRILNHVYVVDQIFKAHLESAVHGHTATNTKDTPSLPVLAAEVAQLDAWFLNYVNQISPASLQEKIRFTFTDGDAGCMDRQEILLHVITHGSYHRGAAGEVMRGAGTPPPRDLYTRFLHSTQSGRRL